MIKYILLFLVVASAMALASAFAPRQPAPAFLLRNVASAAAERTALSMSKKNPKGAPITIQEDEDAAMYFEDKDGKRKQALKGPVGGRPINKQTSQQIQGKGAQKKPMKWPWQK